MPTHNYRLAVDEHGNHGYEIGFWPVNADEGTDYVVVAKCYDQQEAARLAARYDAAPPPDHLPPGESGEGQAADDDEPPHKRTTRRK